MNLRKRQQSNKLNMLMAEKEFLASEGLVIDVIYPDDIERDIENAAEPTDILTDEVD